MSSSIRDHLASRFESRRLVFWHDSESRYTEELDEHVPSGVTVLRVANDEFTIKHRVLREEPSTEFLIYRSGAVPEGTANWLLDLELAYGTFTADRGALLRADLGLEMPGAEDLVAEHEAFFDEAPLVARLKSLLSERDDLVLVQAKMGAAVLEQREHSFSDLMRTLLIQHAAGDSSGYDALANYGLTDFHWAGARKIYGYDRVPNLAAFVLWMFDRARHGFAGMPSNVAGNLARDFSRLRDDRKSSAAMKTLARAAEGDLNYAEDVEEASLTELVATDTFEGGERAIIQRLIEAIRSQTMSARDVAETIRARRRESVWFDDYATVYAALEAAAELLPAIRSARLDPSSFDDGLTHYRDELYRIDQRYRHYIAAAKKTAASSLLEGLTEQVENAYVSDFLFTLGTNWQRHVDAVQTWQTPAITSQSSFYDHYVAPLMRGNANKKAVVVISDAMRYEVAEELRRRIRGENRYQAELEAMLGVLPSYTQLGMAALLPHQTLAHSDSGDPVLVDGQRSDGTTNRSKILAVVDGTAIQAKDFLEKKSEERKKFIAQHRVIYVYHDVIDMTGDKPGSEHHVLDAAARTIDELLSLVKGLANANATNLFVTADHGFLYQDGKLPAQFNLTEKPHGDRLVADKRRYVLGRGLADNAAFRKFLPEQLGLDSDLEVQIPNSVLRNVKSGAGFQFVHGGASLQEIVVPVITVNKVSRTGVNTVEPVNVDIHPETDKITTGQVVVKLYQSAPVTEQRTARRLRAGLYFGNELISDRVERTFDHESTEGRDRFHSVRLLLSKDADEANNKTVEFRLEEPIGDTGEWKKYKSVPYTLKRSFTSDFDF